MLGVAFVDEVFVDLVGEDPPPAVGREPSDLGDLLLAVDSTGGVRRRHEHEHLGPVRCGRLELLRGHFEATRRAGRDFYGNSPREADRLRVRRPVGRGEQHLLTGVEQRREGVVNGVLPTVGDKHLLGRDGVAGVARRLGDDRLFQLGQAAGGRVAVIAGIAAGGDGGLDDAQAASGSPARRRRNRRRRRPGPSAAFALASMAKVARKQPRLPRGARCAWTQPARMKVVSPSAYAGTGSGAPVQGTGRRGAAAPVASRKSDRPPVVSGGPLCPGS